MSYERYSMVRAGIVAEFNPFHTGHRYIIDYAENKLHADSVVIALGHEFTQRGGIAIIDRYTRAKCAIDAGADLVVGMPVIASCASAEIFAECGVCLLHECGCNKIVCGYEGAASTPDTLARDQVPYDSALIGKIAEILIEEPFLYKQILKDNLRAGKSFPKARELALTEYFSTNAISTVTGFEKNIVCDDDNSKSFIRNKISGLVSNPNNILAIEYQKAIIRHGFDMELIPVRRQGTGYNDSTNDGDYVSASFIRHAIDEGDFSRIEKHLTPYSYQALKDTYDRKLLLADDDLSLPLHLALLSNHYTDDSERPGNASPAQNKTNHRYSKYLDVSDDLSDRITNLLPQYTGFESFTDLIRNKSLTASRIRRSLIHILTGITDVDLESLRASELVPYLWILSASRTGFSMLGDIRKKSSVPLFMSINELKDEKGDGSLFHLDMSALELVRALRINKSRMMIPNEYQRKVCT